jgi:hypothetical protein
MTVRTWIRRVGRRSPRGALALALPSMLVFAVNAIAVSAGSATTITGEFSDSCRDFAAHSGKDISNVVIEYVDGRTVKDEAIGHRDFSINGGSGDEIAVVIVKAGTTKATFACTRTNSPPTAILEIRTPPLANCQHNNEVHPLCLGWDERTDWSRPPGGVVGFAFEAPFPPMSFDFRGTSSSDPNNDIVSWSIDFGDGTSTSGNWLTEPPTVITHIYAGIDVLHGMPSVTLTVVDGAGQSSTDTLTLFVVDVTPD